MFIYFYVNKIDIRGLRQAQKEVNKMMRKNFKTTARKGTTVRDLNTMSLNSLIATCAANMVGVSYNSMTGKIEGVVY